MVPKAVVASTVVSNPQYDYTYSVHDQITGDQKSHRESRLGDTTQGEYSLVDPDGFLRTVKYIADHNGFNAVVSRQQGYAQPVSVIAPKFVQAPVVHTPAPLRYVQNGGFSTPTILKNPARLVPITRPRHFYPRLLPQFPVGQNTIAYPTAPQHPKFVFQQPIQQVPISVQPPVQNEPVESPVSSPPNEQPIPSTESPIPSVEETPEPPVPEIPVQAPPASDPQPQDVQADDSDAVVVEALPRRAGSDSGDEPTTPKTSFTYSSKRGSQYDFQVAY